MINISILNVNRSLRSSQIRCNWCNFAKEMHLYQIWVKKFIINGQTYILQNQQWDKLDAQSIIWIINVTIIFSFSLIFITVRFDPTISIKNLVKLLSFKLHITINFSHFKEIIYCSLFLSMFSTTKAFNNIPIVESCDRKFAQIPDVHL